MELTKEQIDEALKGTKYEGADYEPDDSSFYAFPNEAMNELKKDCRENAARVIILQRELEEAKSQRDKLVGILVSVEEVLRQTIRGLGYSATQDYGVSSTKEIISDILWEFKDKIK